MYMVNKRKKSRRTSSHAIKRGGFSVWGVFWKSVAAVFAVAVLVLFGASYYLMSVALSPVECDLERTYGYMYSDYPFLRHWVDSLHRNKALRDTIIVASDGARLHGYIISAPVKTKNTAVVIHGHKCCAVDMFHIAYMYNHDLHYNVLLPELRAHGHSEGTHIQMGWLDRKDARVWLDVANDAFGGDTRMVVHGISMGAATTMMLSGESDQPDFLHCYIEDCGYTSVWDEFSFVIRHDYHLQPFPFLHIANVMCKLRYGWDFKEASAIEQVKRSTKPMLFIHGMSDTYVPSEMVHELYLAKPRDKEIWTKPGVIHARMYHDYPEEYTQEVYTFLLRNN